MLDSHSKIDGHCENSNDLIGWLVRPLWRQRARRMYGISINEKMKNNLSLEISYYKIVEFKSLNEIATLADPQHYP